MPCFPFSCLDKNTTLQSNLSTSSANELKQKIDKVSNQLKDEGCKAYREAREQFLKTPVLVEAAKRWQEGKISGTEAVNGLEQYYQEQIGKITKNPMNIQQDSEEKAEEKTGEKAEAQPKLVGMHIGKLTEQPIFTHFYEAQTAPRPETIFYENDEMIIIPNNKSPLRSVHGNAAAMSYVHILVIPKQRIYNAVSMTHQHLPLLLRLAAKGSECLGFECVRDYYSKYDLAKPALDARFMEFYVHLHPQHSVGQLHIHCCLTNLWTVNGDNLMYKNTRLSDVVSVLEEDEKLALCGKRKSIFERAKESMPEWPFKSRRSSRSEEVVTVVFSHPPGNYLQHEL